MSRVLNAGLRAVLVAMMVALPAVMLPGTRPDLSQIQIFAAIIAGAMVFSEYATASPSFLEFRAAPPFNRMRFAAACAMLVLLTFCVRQWMMAGTGADGLYGFGSAVGRALDVPFSPVRLMLILVPEGAENVESLTRALAGLAFLTGIVTTLLFVIVIRLMRWPIRKSAFNVWVNLPLFDPTAGGDVIYRLKRDANFNVALGFLLPFLVPALVKVGGAFGAAMPFTDSMMLIWIITVWAFVPTSLIMRGVALWRVSGLIEEKRRRAYAQSDALQAA